MSLISYLPAKHTYTHIHTHTTHSLALFEMTKRNPSHSANVPRRKAKQQTIQGFKKKNVKAYQQTQSQNKLEINSKQTQQNKLS